MKEKNHAWELLGAVVGAGLASGREIASFFAQYGLWGFAGTTLAAGALLLGGAEMPDAWRGCWIERLWRVMMTMLLISTGGAMLAGAGEVAVLAVPVAYLRWPGMAATLLLAWMMAKRGKDGLAWVSQVMMALLAFLILLAMTLPPMRAVTMDAAPAAAALIKGVAYGGFNAALMQPLLSGTSLSAAERRRSLWLACMMTGCLLAAGNAALLRHPALLADEMPFLGMMRRLGKGGAWLGLTAVYLAILSTLTACLRSLRRKAAVAGIVLMALAGFSGVVGLMYPLLGGGCAVMLAAMRMANFRNSSRRPFLSRRRMI